MASVLEYLTLPSTWTSVSIPRTVILRRLNAHAKGGIPSLTFEVHSGVLPVTPDPWLGKVVRLTINSTVYFYGDVIRADPSFQNGRSWVTPYTAAGRRNRGDWIPHTDSNNGSDSSSYNLSSDNQRPEYLPSRAGRTVGEILLDVLSGGDNAAAMIGVGLGNYTSPGYGAAGVVTMSGSSIASIAVAAGGGGTGYSVAPLVVPIGGGMTVAPVLSASISGGAVTGFTVTSGGTFTSTPAVLVTTLPATTVADLLAMVFQPPGPVYFGGEKLLGGVDGFLSTWCANYLMTVEPGGDLRFADMRLYANTTLTLGTDPIRPSGISRDLSECFQRVLVRGASLAEMFKFSTKLGTLSDSPFAHDALSVAAAKAAWVPDDYFRPEKGKGRLEGTCTCPSTTTVTVTSAISTIAFASNEWDQTTTGRHGMLTLTYAAAADVNMGAQRQVVSNTAMTAGGTSTLTLDRALPHLLYDHFTMTGLSRGASAVWIDYALPAWAGPKVTLQSYLPMPLKYAGGNAETLISTATGVIRWSSSGNPPYQEGISGITIDAGSGIIRFNYPTRLTAGKEPDDVEVWIPIYTSVNHAIWPADSAGPTPNYDGTSYTVNGLTKTLTVTVNAWRDPANLAGMLLYAADMLDSVKDAVCEGTITYLGLYEPALAPGNAYSVTGTGYTTGWEGLSLANVETQLEWSVDGLSHVTTIRVSSRRAHFSAEAFMHPDRTGVTFDWDPDASLFGGGFIGGGAVSPLAIGVESLNASQAADVSSQGVSVGDINAASTGAASQFTSETGLTRDTELMNEGA
jgi:hypothetical protein